MQSNKDKLLQEANEVNSFLTLYIKIHNERVRRAGTLSSLLKNIFFSKSVNFGQLHNSTKELLDLFDKKDEELDKLKKNDYRNFNETEKEFFNSLRDYFTALHNTIKTLLLITEAQYKTSLGGKNKISFNDNMKLEKEYDNARNDYISLGEDLMDQYSRLADNR